MLTVLSLYDIIASFPAEGLPGRPPAVLERAIFLNSKVARPKPQSLN